MKKIVHGRSVGEIDPHNTRRRKISRQTNTTADRNGYVSTGTGNRSTRTGERSLAGTVRLPVISDGGSIGACRWYSAGIMNSDRVGGIGQKSGLCAITHIKTGH